MRRLRVDFPDYELRDAVVRTARREYPCDIHLCSGIIRAGWSYAYLSTHVRVCLRHFEPADIVETPK